MSPRSRRILVIVILLLLALLALLWFGRCSKTSAPVAAKPAAPAATAPAPVATRTETPAPAPAPPAPDEVLTPATVQVPSRVAAGARFQVQWTGPDNPGDYVTIVRPAEPAARYGSYNETRRGPALELVAPLDAGDWEVRYVAVRSKTILGRAAIVVDPIAATIDAPADVVAGAKFPVTWEGPKNSGDYLTVVPKDVPDGQYRNYADVTKGSPLELTAPMETGDAEVRYMTGGKARVLARRPIVVRPAAVSLEAPAEVVAGAAVSVTWSGPNNRGDYITIVPRTLPDGQYANYADTIKGSPLKVTAPMQRGEYELRYMSGQGAKVLARRPLAIVPAEITITSPGTGAAGTTIAVEWTGPNHAGDYLTLVPKSAKDGVSRASAWTSRGSPAKINVSKETTGPCEIRYMSGQGNVVLARADIEIR